MYKIIALLRNKSKYLQNWMNRINIQINTEVGMKNWDLKR